MAPQLRLTKATMPLPDFVTVVAALPYAALLIYPIFRPVRGQEFLDLAVGGLLLLLFSLASYPVAYRSVWYAARPLTAVVVVASVLLFLRVDSSKRFSPTARSQVFLFSSVAALFSLIQYPYAHGVYFYYTAPLLILAIARLVSVERWAPKTLHVCVLVFCLAFGAYWLNTNMINVTAFRHLKVEQDSRLPGERAGIRVPERIGVYYGKLLRTIEDHSAEGSYIYAAPDCPEVYFLSGRKNPTRSMYQLFDESPKRTEGVLDLIDRHDIKVVVINDHPEFSPTISDELRDALKARFLFSKEVFRFTILWRDSPTDAKP